MAILNKHESNHYIMKVCGCVIVTRIINVKIPGEKIKEFCRRNHITRISLFGSALHGDFREDSDIDLLVEFDPDHIPGLIRLAGMEIELTELLGRKVDLRTPQDLSGYFRQEVMNEAQVQYAEG